MTYTSFAHSLGSYKSDDTTDSHVTDDEYRRVASMNDFEIALALRMLDAVVVCIDKPYDSLRAACDSLYDIKEILKNVGGDV